MDNIFLESFNIKHDKKLHPFVWFMSFLVLLVPIRILSTLSGLLVCLFSSQGVCIKEYTEALYIAKYLDEELLIRNRWCFLDLLLVNGYHLQNGSGTRQASRWTDEC